jgi:hypothetical protein
LIGEDALCSFAEQDNWGMRRSKELLFLLIDLAESHRGRDIGHHDGERLLIAELAASKLRHGIFISGIADQLVTPKAFQSSNLPEEKSLSKVSHLIIRCNVIAWTIAHRYSRPAGWTGDWLCMKAAIAGVLIFGPAIGTHGERSHRGLRSVVRTTGYDRQTWTAVRAIEKWIAIVAIGWIEQFRETFPASRHIRGNEDVAAKPNIARLDPEIVIALSCPLFPREFFDVGEWRRIFGKSRKEEIEEPQFAFDLDLNSPCPVANETAQAVPQGKVVDEGTKSNPLNDAANLNRQSLDHIKLPGRS